MNAFVELVLKKIEEVSEKQGRNEKLSSNILDALSKTGERLEKIEKIVKKISEISRSD